MKKSVRRVWFKRKLYGWGWTPSTWEGWTVLCVFLFLYLINFLNFEETIQSRGSFAWLIVRAAALLLILFCFTYIKGEKPRWQWGKDKGDD